jgi:sulfatase maturation enzyme AslB (radical SAM superfamily)
MPFNHLHLDPDGGARICCIASESIQDNGRPVSLYTHRVEDIWRSTYMRDVRRAMLQGKPLKTCEQCYQYESVGAVSFRDIFNQSSNYSSFPAEFFTAEASDLPLGRGMEDEAVARQHLDADLVDGPPRWYQILLGHHCNLKCRMCGSDLSSSIEADPVHSRWTPNWNTSLPFWKKGAVSIGPKAQIGIRYDGFGALEYHDGLPRCWTNGNATISLPWTKDQPLASVEIELWPELVWEASVLIEVNGTQFPMIDVQPGATVIENDLSSLAIENELAIRIISRKWNPDDSGRLKPSFVGLPIRDIRLHRPKTRQGGRRALGGRFSGDGPWYQQTSLLFGELLADAKRLKKIKITGGEPLLSPHTEDVLEYLIDCGAAADMVLDLTTNCTKVNDELLAKLGKFQRVEIGMSIDGTKLDQEYIRFPAKWEEVSENAKSFLTLKNAYFQVQPTVQLYNMLTISDLLKWCDDLNIRFYPQFLFYPHHLSIDLAPPEAFRRAAERLIQAIPAVANPDNRDHASRLARAFADKAAGGASGATHSEERKRLVHDFMRFTNDLDKSRGQSFRDTYPEMVQLFADDGYHWHDETRFLRNQTSGDRQEESTGRKSVRGV